MNLIHGITVLEKNIYSFSKKKISIKYSKTNICSNLCNNKFITEQHLTNLYLANGKSEPERKLVMIRTYT